MRIEETTRVVIWVKKQVIRGKKSKYKIQQNHDNREIKWRYPQHLQVTALLDYYPQRGKKREETAYLCFACRSCGTIGHWRRVLGRMELFNNRGEVDQNRLIEGTLCITRPGESSLLEVLEHLASSSLAGVLIPSPDVILQRWTRGYCNTRWYRTPANYFSISIFGNIHDTDK